MFAASLNSCFFNDFSESMEHKFPLLWSTVLYLSLEGCELDTVIVRNCLQKFAAILLEHSGEKNTSRWGQGFLGALGIVKQPQISLK